MRRRRKPTRSANDVTTITARGQTVVPAKIRARLGLREGSCLAWLASPDGEYIVVTPVPDDPIEAYAGIDRGQRGLERLLEERRRERARDPRKT